MKDLKILKELRKGPLQSMKDDEYAMIEEQVTKMGIDGLNGYAKRMIEKGMREMASAMKKSLRDITKHEGGGHDQASHGSWAGEGGGSGTGDAYANSARNKVDNAYETVRYNSEFEKIPNSKKALDLLDKTFVALQEAQFAIQPLPKLRAAQSASALLQEVKTDFLDKMDSSSKSKFSGFISEVKGAFSDTEKLSSKILSNFDDEGNPVNKATSVAQGDMVSWNSSGGTARGKVIRVVREGKINVPDSSFEISAEEGDPAVLIQLYRDGKPTDTKVGHKMSTLKKNFDLAKHGDHNQSSHGNWSNDDDSEGEDESESKNPKPKFVAYDDDSEGEFADLDADDPRWMDDMDILRPPKRKS
jgi:hypothetical protein